ncbi:MAG: membrane integrity-associated transporter subunit PqiC [Desulfuromonas sp.]|nr:membrane integrity-associated transporter subunit PqiC [Desulfuromonas sp.]
MNNSFIHLAAAAFLAVTLLGGCIGSSPKTSYYSLYAPAQVPPPAIGAVPSALAVSVGPVNIPDILKQTKIATGGADGRYQLAEYHRWSGELDRDIARSVAEQLAGDLGTQQVALFPWDQNLTPTCRVSLDVLYMGGEPAREATLAVRWALVDPKGENPLLIRRSELKEIPADAGYPAWVAAQQRNVAKLAQEIAALVKTLPH